MSEHLFSLKPSSRVVWRARERERERERDSVTEKDRLGSKSLIQLIASNVQSNIA